MICTLSTPMSLPQTPRPNVRQVLREPYPPISKSNWNCNVGGIPAGKYSNKAVDAAIEEALKILETCKSCRDIFGSTDPIALLKRLKAMSAIFVTDRLPDRPRKAKNPFGGYVPASMPWPKEIPQPVATVDSQLEKGRPRKPCIYVNFTGMLADREVPEYDDKDMLAQVRAELILHELGHCAKAIPSDSPKTKKGTAQSLENTNCIIRNCRVCGTYSPCRPLPQSTNARGGAVPP